LAVQEAKYESAMKDLNNAQALLDDKQRELDEARALYDQAMMEKQASSAIIYADYALTCTDQCFVYDYLLSEFALWLRLIWTLS